MLIGATCLLLSACSEDSAADEGNASTTTTSAPPATAAPTQPNDGADQNVAVPQTEVSSVPQPNADAAMSYVRALTVDIGPRPSGTPEEQTAARYIAGLFERFGYHVEQQRFPVVSFVNRRAEVTLQGPDARSIATQPITMSAPGDVTGEIVGAGSGRGGEFPQDAAGKIALVARDGRTTFREMAMNAHAAGATAVLVYNNAAEMFLGSLREQGPAIPILAISGTDGQALLRDMERGSVRVRVLFDGGVEQSDSINVIARPESGRCEVLAGGHYDSVPGAPGASDNASGTAAVIEMARVTALRGNATNACFAVFGSEETGLEGSAHFVQQMTEEQRRSLRAMLNFDMVAYGNEWLLIGSPELQRQGQSLAGTLGVTARLTGLPSGSDSDHSSFIRAGIPALMLHRSDDPLLHTPEDVIARLSPAQLEEAALLGLAFIEGRIGG